MTIMSSMTIMPSLGSSSSSLVSAVAVGVRGGSQASDNDNSNNITTSSDPPSSAASFDNDDIGNQQQHQHHHQWENPDDPANWEETHDDDDNDNNNNIEDDDETVESAAAVGGAEDASWMDEEEQSQPDNDIDMPTKEDRPNVTIASDDNFPDDHRSVQQQQDHSPIDDHDRDDIDASHEVDAEDDDQHDDDDHDHDDGDKKDILKYLHSSAGHGNDHKDTDESEIISEIRAVEETVKQLNLNNNNSHDDENDKDGENDSDDSHDNDDNEQAFVGNDQEEVNEEPQVAATENNGIGDHDSNDHSSRNNKDNNSIRNSMEPNGAFEQQQQQDDNDNDNEDDVATSSRILLGHETKKYYDHGDDKKLQEEDTEIDENGVHERQPTEELSPSLVQQHRHRHRRRRVWTSIRNVSIRKTSSSTSSASDTMPSADDDNTNIQTENSSETAPSIRTSNLDCVDDDEEDDEQHQQRRHDDHNQVESSTATSGIMHNDDKADAEEQGSHQDDGDDTTSNSVEEIAYPSVPERRQAATTLRLQGKELHDGGDYGTAAQSFAAAAAALRPALLLLQHEQEQEENDEVVSMVAEEYATCRLHEALCRLKADEYDAAAQACTDVLSLGEEGDHANDLEGDEDDQGNTNTEQRAIGNKIGNDNNDTKPNHNPVTMFRHHLYPRVSVAPALRARAYHRRAKARVALGLDADALQDACSAAFLGDRKAVALYGKLMRGQDNSGHDPLLLFPSSSSSSSLSSAASRRGFNEMSASNALFESVLSKAGPAADVPNPLSTMNSMFDMSSMFSSFIGEKRTGQSGASLAKSVLKSLSKRLEDEHTHDSISSFLQGLSGPQLQGMATMVGMPLPASQAEQFAIACQSVTSKSIRRTVRTTKRVVYVVQLIRKIMAVVDKYRPVLILLALFGFIRSAIRRPFPVNPRIAREAARAAKQAALLAARQAVRQPPPPQQQAHA